MTYNVIKKDLANTNRVRKLSFEDKIHGAFNIKVVTNFIL